MYVFLSFVLFVVDHQCETWSCWALQLSVRFLLGLGLLKILNVTGYFHLDGVLVPGFSIPKTLINYFSAKPSWKGHRVRRFR